VFSKLSTERQLGMSAGPIPIRIIWEWLDREGVADRALRDHLETVLMLVDALYSKRMRDAAEVKNRPTPKKKRR
jgi:hypothetical protein